MYETCNKVSREKAKDHVVLWGEPDFAVHHGMARPRRVHFPGLSVHVIQRGVGGATIFADDHDYETFVAIFRATLTKTPVSVHGFALMKTHFHLLVTPDDAKALPSLMQIVGGTYVGYFNERYSRFGSLWAGRYRSIPIGDERYWLTCLRYIDLNPVSANIVVLPEAYPWCSYRAHALGESLDWITHHHVYLALGNDPAERQAAYRALCGKPLDPYYLVQLEHARQDTPAFLASAA